LGSGGENYTLKGEEFIQFCSQKVKHWIAAVLKQKCARMHQILFQFHFFLHAECVQRISVHIQYAVEHQQYNCNQEIIENNQLIGFANARPEYRHFRATVLQFLRSQNHSKDDINTVSFCHQCEISV